MGESERETPAEGRAGRTDPAPTEPVADPRAGAAPGIGAGPARPLLEAGLVFAAFYLSAYFPVAPAAIGGSLGRPLYHAMVAAETLPKALLLLYLMHRGGGLAGFGLGGFSASDAARGLAAALGAVAILALPALGLSALGLKNGLLAAAARPDSAPVAVVASVIASALAVGYGEELFFRVYLIRRLGQAGLGPLPAAVASSLLFGSAHGAQGVLGLVLAALLGLWFAWRWLDGRRYHEIALGHAIYDAGIVIFTLYG